MGVAIVGCLASDLLPGDDRGTPRLVVLVGVYSWSLGSRNLEIKGHTVCHIELYSANCLEGPCVRTVAPDRWLLVNKDKIIIICKG